MSRPLATRLILLLAACAALLCAPGCNPDTRELLLDPRLPTAQPYTGGSWTTKPVLTCGRSTYALAAWDRDDVLVAGGDGLAVRVQGGEARNIDVPTRSRLVAAAAQPGGRAWVAAFDGTIYRLDGEAWTVELRSAVRVLALCSLPDGVVFGVGYGGGYSNSRGYGLRRTPAGVWEEFDTGVSEPLRSLWGRDKDDCWAVGYDGVVAHFDGVTWSVERPFGSSPYLSLITGDADGRVAVADGVRVHLREDGAWRDLPELPDSEGVAQIVFLGGRLLAWSRLGRYHWDGGVWLEEFAPEAAPDRHAVVGDDLVMLLYGGALKRLVGGETETLLPALGKIVDFEAAPGGAVLLTSEGWIVRETEGGWRLETQLIGSHMWDTGVGRNLVRSPAGELLAVVHGTLYRELSEDWEPLAGTAGRQFSGVFQLGNGELLLWDGSRLWMMYGGGCLFMCDPPDAWSRLLSVAGDTRSEARYLFPELLARFDGVTMLPVANVSDGDRRQLAHDPVEGLLLFGPDGLFAVDYPASRDITPRIEASGAPERADIRDFAVTPNGDWLAWTGAGRLLRRRVGLWHSLDATESSPLWNRGPAALGRSLRGVGAGDAWLISASHLFRYHDTAP